MAYVQHCASTLTTNRSATRTRVNTCVSVDRHLFVSLSISATYACGRARVKEWGNRTKLRSGGMLLDYRGAIVGRFHTVAGDYRRKRTRVYDEVGGGARAYSCASLVCKLQALWMRVCMRGSCAAACIRAFEGRQGVLVNFPQWEVSIILVWQEKQHGSPAPFKISVTLSLSFFTSMFCGWSRAVNSTR
jgi:hypothetical protein